MVMNRLLETLTPIQDGRGFLLEVVKEDKYSLEVFVDNAVFTQETEKVLTSHLVGSYKLSNEAEGLRLIISKVNLPRVITPSALLDEYTPESLLLGLGEFGLCNIPLDRLTMMITGNPGMGKSSFFSFLLSQVLSLEVGEHYIVDGKGVDYSLFKKNPIVKEILTEDDKVRDLLFSVKEEMVNRAKLFKKAYERSPIDLNEYKEFKIKYKRDDLPELEPIYVWIDEAHKYFPNLAHSSRDRERTINTLEGLIREGRAFGINIIISTHRLNDIYSSVRDMMKQFVFFYSQYNAQAMVGLPDFSGKVKAIPGRFMYFESEDRSMSEIHSPFLTQREATCISLRPLINEDIKKKNDEIKRGLKKKLEAKKVG